MNRIITMPILFVKQFFTNFCITFPFLLILVKERLQKAGDPMKLFKTTPQPPDGYAILLDNLKQTTAELQNTYANLENVVDPDLIDYYIYQAKAVQMRYKFLLGCVKIEGKHIRFPPDRSHFTEILYKKPR